MAVLEVRNMVKSFGKTEVLKDVSFSVERGDVISIIGSSGSGKTTLLRCINFLETPEGGSISVDGNVIFDAASENKIPEKEKRKNRLRFGLVFQDFNLFPQYTALGNVTLAMKLLAKDGLKTFDGDIEEIAKGYLEQVGLADKIDLYPCNLSGGQKQRVAIAGVIAMKRKCIIFDESTAMLDPMGRREVMEIIEKLNKEEKITVILITHHMNEAAMADRIIVMKDGKMIGDGTPSAVFGDPEKMWAAGLDVPQTTELLYKMRKRGLDVPLDIFDTDECAAVIAEAIRNKKYLV